MSLQLHRHSRLRFVFGFAATLAVAAASTPRAVSPTPELIPARDAWRYAESITAARSDCEVMVGVGGSMLPLYPDHTVLIVQRLPMSELQSGMTVVYIGDRGRPVAHTLVEKTWRGWLARGLANAEADRTIVAQRNYLGTVIRAFTPTVGAPPISEAAGQ